MGGNKVRRVLNSGGTLGQTNKNDPIIKIVLMKFHFLWSLFCFSLSCKYCRTLTIEDKLALVTFIFRRCQLLIRMILQITRDLYFQFTSSPRMSGAWVE